TKAGIETTLDAERFEPVMVLSEARVHCTGMLDEPTVLEENANAGLFVIRVHIFHATDLDGRYNRSSIVSV
ncbi:unnamed protein product, partial [Tilletia controversa]